MVNSVVVLTGAGISAESGIQTFRAVDGLWENHAVEDVATPEGFQRDPQRVYHFYNERRRMLLSDAVRPNAAHYALAEFESAFAGRFLLITQNIDNLHEQAGSRKLIHMHGELLKMRCVNSNLVFDLRDDISFDSHCRCCRLPGNLRPHVVWFGEIPLGLDVINEALENCDLFIAIGTSGNVYPASGFYQTAMTNQARAVELNLEPTGAAYDVCRYGAASKVVPEFFSALLQGQLPFPESD
ncbi:MAG: Sir2 family NAD+-dependent deacetylase [Pseudohongiellaceae bacterium]